MVSLCAYLLFIALSVQGGAAAGIAGGLLAFCRVSMFAAVILTVVSGAQYFWNARHIIFRV
mgnify:CR=1 FL=1